MNMQSVVGLNGNNHKTNKIGTIFSEFKFKLHQLINSQVIEHYLHGLVNRMVVSFTYQHTHTQIKKVLVMLMYLKTFHTKIDTRNGSLFTLVIQDHRRKLLQQSLGKILKTNKIMITSSILQFQNITSSLVKTNNSQDSMDNLLQFHSMLEKAHLNQMVISKLKVIHSTLMQERRNQLEFSQKLTQKRIQQNKRNHTKQLMMQQQMV